MGRNLVICYHCCYHCVLASPQKTRASSGEGRGHFQHHCLSPANKVIRNVTKLTMRFKLIHNDEVTFRHVVMEQE